MYRYKRDTNLTEYSRLNRKNQTEAEKLMWSHLRRKQLNGCKFNRQYAINNYILDFYCVEKRLAVELDGSQHVDQITYDNKRTRDLETLGITVLRFWDNEVFTNICQVPIL